MKEAFYFSHDSNAQRDPKIIKLLQKHNWQGYGIYWAIIETLREQPNYILSRDYDLLAYAMRTQCEFIKSVIEDFNLFIITEDSFYSESLIKRMKMKEEKSEKAKKAAIKRWNDTFALQSHKKGNAIKEKEKKEKEKKLNTYKELFDSIKEEFELSKDLEDVFLVWLKYKSERKQSYTETGLKTFIKKTLLDTNGDVNKIKNMIVYSISNNYQGLYEEKKNGTNITNITKNELREFSESIANDSRLK